MKYTIRLEKISGEDAHKVFSSQTYIGDARLDYDGKYSLTPYSRGPEIPGPILDNLEDINIRINELANDEFSQGRFILKPVEH